MTRKNNHSLDKAARKQADTWKALLSPGQIETLVGEFIWFAQRHGAKVRRETLKEVENAVKNLFGGRAHTYASENGDTYRVQDETIKTVCERIRFLPLTPRGPEKGRRTA